MTFYLQILFYLILDFSQHTSNLVQLLGCELRHLEDNSIVLGASFLHVVFFNR